MAKPAYTKTSRPATPRPGPEYLPKDLAEKKSGLSARRLLELAARGDIRKQHVYDPKSKRRIAVFHAVDIAALTARGPIIAEAKSHVTQLIPLRKDAGSLATLPLPTSAGVPAAPAAPRPWLTVGESADYSGLPASFLAHLVENGRLPALDVGVRPGGRWRIARRDIDAIKGEKRH